MNRTEIVRVIAEQEELPLATVQRVLRGFFDFVGLSLSAGDDVVLRHFGKFQPRERRAVVRRNPMTGEEYQVPAKTSVGFVPSSTLKARLNQNQ